MFPISAIWKSYYWGVFGWPWLLADFNTVPLFEYWAVVFGEVFYWICLDWPPVVGLKGLDVEVVTYWCPLWLAEPGVCFEAMTRVLFFEFECLVFSSSSPAFITGVWSCLRVVGISPSRKFWYYATVSLVLSRVNYYSLAILFIRF